MKNARPTVSAIVPVHNEEKGVWFVLNTLLNSPLITEIICINDGSTDRSLQIIKSFKNKIKLINFTKNQGKGAAVIAGIKKATGDYLFFCDSDLINFTTNHIEQMLEPIFSKRVQVVLAVPTQKNDGSYGRQELFLAGERVYPRKMILPHLNRLAGLRGAGSSEIYLNKLIKIKDLEVVPLFKLFKPAKHDKWPRKKAIEQYFLSAYGILKETKKAQDLYQLENIFHIDTFSSLTDRLKQAQYFYQPIRKYASKIFE